MDTLVIEHNGPLRGRVEVSGAKNAALPIMAACLLTEDESIIERVPRVTDVLTMAQILRTLGVSVEWENHALRIRPGASQGWTAPYELVSLMRASVCVLGPLLARHGRARVSMPGGCVIGARPIDLHLKGLQALGATITMEHGDIMAEGASLRGTTIHLAGSFGSSVLATANVMMAAVLADGQTTIEHAACEPEVVDLAECLIAMGGRISGQGTPKVSIEGVRQLHGARHRIIPDRIEAGTWLIAAALTGGDVVIADLRPDHLGALITTLQETGIAVDMGAQEVRVHAQPGCRSVNVTTLPFPGFPTDLQAPMMALMSLSRGVSLVTDKIYPERFTHVPELKRMGAHITREGPTAVVTGVERLSGAPVKASDLRAAAALALAGLAAERQTVVQGVEHLDRGYEQFEQKLMRLGARVHRERG